MSRFSRHSESLRVLRNALRLVDRSLRRRAYALVVLALAVSVFEAAGALLIFALLTLLSAPQDQVVLPMVGNLREHFSAVSDAKLALYLSLFVAVVFMLRAGAYLAQSYWQSRIGHEVGADLGARLLSGYLDMPFKFHLERNTAEMIRNAHLSTNELAVSVFVPSVTLASDALMISALFAVLLLIQPVITLGAVLLFVPVIVLTLRFVQPRIVSAGVESQEMHESSIRFLQQAIRAVREISVLGRQSFFVDQFRIVRDRLARAYYLRSVFVDSPRIIVETLLVFSILGLLAATVAGGESTGQALALIGVFAYTALRVMPSLNRMLSNLNTIRFGSAAIADVIADLSITEPDEVYADVSRLPFHETVCLEKVSFTYLNSPGVALSELSLAIKAGETIGIVGSTGSGKSTLLNVIAGFLDPTSGYISIDSARLTPANRRQWQLNIGLVPQEVFLLDDSVARNIALGLEEEEIDIDRVWEALQVAQLDAFVRSLPGGVDNVVGEQGVKLSGGQRQRIAIARALYSQPSLLMLDEGTSALDDDTERELIRCLAATRTSLTTVMVAHRLSSLASSDRILRLERGMLVDIGTYDDIIGRSRTKDPSQ